MYDTFLYCMGWKDFESGELPNYFYCDFEDYKQGWHDAKVKFFAIDNR